jgi:hypothetical protein
VSPTAMILCSRHVCQLAFLSQRFVLLTVVILEAVVFFFRGRRTCEGDDALVLSRRDRRVATALVNLACLISALTRKMLDLFWPCRERSELRVLRTSVPGSFTWPCCVVMSSWPW